MNRAVSQNRKGFKLRAGPSGLHLFDRTTGWNVLADEVRVPPAQWARAPGRISVALTNACDLKCAYCYAPKTFGSLDTDRLAGWLRELDENGCLGVGFGGGEPTLHRNFTKICQQTAKQTRLAVTFTTHAHRITPEYADQLTGSVHFIRVSMDGIGATYEALRGRPFAALLSRVKIVRDIAPFGINYVVNARTLPDLDGALELSGDLGVSEFLLLPEQPVDGSAGIDQETLSALRMWIGRYKGRIPLAISEGHEKEVLCGTFSGESSRRAYAHIDAKGFLKRTSYDTEGILIGRDGVMEALRRFEDGTAEGQQP
jgi:sulfatase maturation enzyme AslB (radical SAM superfamily)